MALRPPIMQFQARGHKRKTAPAAEPVTAAELRTFLREDSTTLDDITAGFYIKQAREFLEEATGLAFIEQVWTMTIDNWPGYAEQWWDGVREMHIGELKGGRPFDLQLPRYPLVSLDAVTTYDTAGNDTAVVVADVFDVDTQSTPGRIALKFGQLWPEASQPTSAIVIEYTAGFSDTATEIPALLRGAVLDLAGYYFSHRGECDIVSAAGNSGAMAKVGMFAARGV